MRYWHKCYQYTFLIFALLHTPCWAEDLSSVQSTTRGVTVISQNPQKIIPISGEYWALIIAIDKYKNLPPLHSAKKDARALKDVLHERYGFSDSRIKMLVDEEATRSNIEGALIKMGQKTKPDDSVLIYFAGHGEYNEDSTLGWWVPVDADPENQGTYILDAAVRNYVRSMRAQHVYLVADSCFSGNLFASNRSLAPINDQFYSKLQAKRSRWGLTSGNLEPVSDNGLNGHSVFAYYFIKFLKENTSLYVVPSEIANHVIPLVANNSAQLPRSQPLQGANHEGGQLVFRLTEALVNALEENRRLEMEASKKDEEQQQQEARIRKRLQDLEAELAEARKGSTLTSQEETQLRQQLREQEGLLKQVEQERQNRLALQKQLEEQKREEAKMRARLQDLEAQVDAKPQKSEPEKFDYFFGGGF